MNDMMKKLLEKKSKDGKMLPDHEKEAKMSVLHDLKNHMNDMMANKVDGLKKVSVMSDSPEGLKEGLDKAQELLHHPKDSELALPSDSDKESGESLEEEASESPEEEALESPEEEMSEGDIDAKIAHLMALKSKKKV